MTYRDDGEGITGPSIECLEVKRAWRRFGLGGALLKAVEANVRRLHTASGHRTSARLGLCNVAGERRFGEKVGFGWVNNKAGETILRCR